MRRFLRLMRVCSVRARERQGRYYTAARRQSSLASYADFLEGPMQPSPHTQLSPPKESAELVLSKQRFGFGEYRTRRNELWSLESLRSYSTVQFRGKQLLDDAGVRERS
ncbi:hypothetical protein Bbelb_167030 [Branchiostoma belcheri]|nr:hypothetical protein Bbelb_167030 [Branchiostoma belcheri]